VNAKKTSNVLKKEIPADKVAFPAMFIGIILFIAGLGVVSLNSETADITGTYVWFAGSMVFLAGFVVQLLNER
jgi:hypothetical protein